MEIVKTTLKIIVLGKSVYKWPEIFTSVADSSRICHSGCTIVAVVIDIATRVT